MAFIKKKNSSLTSNYLLFYSGEGDNIRVYVRVRPPDKHLETDVDRTPCLEVTSGNTIVLQSKPDPKNFSFDHVADINTTQVSHTLSQKLANKFCIFFLSPFVSCANFFVYFLQLACIAWRFWLGALSNKGGRGQGNREEIGAEAT